MMIEIAALESRRRALSSRDDELALADDAVEQDVNLGGIVVFSLDRCGGSFEPHREIAEARCPFRLIEAARGEQPVNAPG
jgi:hypothetical protein